jgi:hypothetical protein
MDRSATPIGIRIRIGTAALFAVLLLNSGCLSLEKQSWNPFKPDFETAHHMDVIWYKNVRYIPDPTQGGAPRAGIAARMYLWHSEKSGEPILGDGQVIVEVYDETKPAGPKGFEPVESTTFPKSVLPALLQKDKLKGDGGYTLLIPCPPNVTQVHFTVRYEPAAKGGPVLLANSDSIRLDRGDEPSQMASQPIAKTVAK